MSNKLVALRAVRLFHQILRYALSVETKYISASVLFSLFAKCSGIFFPNLIEIWWVGVFLFSTAQIGSSRECSLL